MTASLPRCARILSTVDETVTVRTLTLDISLSAEPGQFAMAWLPGVDERPFSLADVNPVMLTVARVGRFTEAIHYLRAGEQLWIRGPLGRPFSLPDRPPSPYRGESAALPVSGLLMVGGGYGVAPLHFLARRAVTSKWKVAVVVGARTAADVVFAGRLRRLGACVTVTTDDGTQGEPGLATDAVSRLLNQGAYAALYACGPEAMLDAVERLGREHRLPTQLSYERAMRCAFGVCGTCSRQGWLVCRDGPVKTIEP